MSSQIDQRVVEMRFDNAQFEAAVSQTMSTLAKLENSLKLDGASKGLDGLQKSVDTVSFAHMQQSIDKIAGHFSVWGMAVDTAISNVVTNVQNKLRGIVNDFTVAPVTDGWKEYELKMGSVQTIMASTGASLQDVNRYLAELNTYSDKTIYSFSDMTASIGKFTNAGVDLDTAVKAIQGISNEAAVSGANAQEASRAMYNFAQALSAGYVKLIDWKSIENANMATVEFKNELLKTAVACGTVKDAGNGMYTVLTKSGQGGTMKDAISATKSFNDSLSYQWMTTEVLTKTLTKYADETTEIGDKAFHAAQDVKTFSQLMDTLKEAIGSGWATTFEIIFGDFEQGKQLWTSINNVLSGIIDKTSDLRNGFLRAALGPKEFNKEAIEGLVQGSSFISRLHNDLGELGKKFKTTKQTTVAFEDALKALARNSGIDIDAMIKESGSLFATFDKGWFSADMLANAVKDLGEPVKATTQSLKDLEEVAKKVIGGEFGNGDDRINKLKEAGYDYASVQQMVNHLLLGTELHLENLSEEQLKSKGYTEQQIAVLKALQKQAEETGTPLNELLETMARPTGRDLLIESFANIFKSFSTILGAFKEGFSELFGTFTGEDLYQLIVGFHDLTEQMLPASELLVGPIKNGIQVVAAGIEMAVNAIKSAIAFVIPILEVAAGTALKGVTILIDDVSVALEYVIATLQYFGEIFSSSFLKPLLDYLQEVAYYVVGAVYLGFLRFRIALLRARKALDPIITSIKAFIRASEPIIRSKLATAFVRLKQVFSDLKVIFIDTVDRLGDFGKISETVAGLITPLYDRIESIINTGGSFEDKVTQIKDALLGFGKAVADTVVENTVLKDAIDFLKQKFEELRTTVFNFTGLDISKVFEAIKDTIHNLIEEIKKLPIVNDFFGTITQALEDIKSSGLFKWLKDQFTNLKQTITDFFGLLGTKEGEVQTLEITGDGGKGMFATLLSVIEPLTSLSKSNANIDTKSITENVQTIFGTIVSAINNTVSKINPTGIIIFATVVGVLYNIVKLLNAIGGIIGSAAKITKGVSSLLDNLSASLKQQNKSQKAEDFYKVAKGVLALAFSLYLISTIDSAKLGAVAFSLALVLGFVAIVMNALAKLRKPAESADDKVKNKLTEFMDSLKDSLGSLADSAKFVLFAIGFATAVMIFAGAIMKLAGIPFLAALQGIFLGGLIAIGLTKMVKELQKAKDGLTMGDALSFVAIALAIGMLVGTLKKLGKIIDKSGGVSVFKAFVALAGIMVLMGGLVIAIKKFAGDAGDMAKVGLGLLLTAMAIGKVASAVSKLAKIPFWDLAAGVAAIVVITVAFTALTGVLACMGEDGQKAVKTIKSFASTILLIAIALGLLTVLTAKGDLWSSVGGIVVLIGSLTVALIVLANFAPQLVGVGEAFKAMGDGIKSVGLGIALVLGSIALFILALPLLADSFASLGEKIQEKGPFIEQAILGLVGGLISVIIKLIPTIIVAGAKAIWSIITGIIGFFQSYGPYIVGAFKIVVGWIAQFGANIWAFITGWAPQWFAGIWASISQGFAYLAIGAKEAIAGLALDIASHLPFGLGDSITDWANGVLEDLKAEKEKLASEMENVSDGPSDEQVTKAYDKSSAIKTGTANTVATAKESAAEIKDAASEAYLDDDGTKDQQVQEYFDISETVTTTTEGNTTAINDASGAMQEAIANYMPGFDLSGEFGELGLGEQFATQFDISNAMGGITQTNVGSINDSASQTSEATSSFFSTITSASGMDASALYDTFSGDGFQSITGFKDGFMSGTADTTGAVSGTFGDVASAARSALGIASPSKVFKEMGQQSAEGYEIGLKETTPKAQKQIAEMVNGSLKNATAQNSKWRTVGRSFGNTFAGGLRAAVSSARSAGRSLSAAALSGIKAHTSNEFRNLGKNAGDGYVNGIKAKSSAVYTAAYNLAKTAKRGTADGQRSQSPSKEFMVLGNYAGEGYAIGMGQMSGVVETASTSMAEDAIEAMQNTVQYIKDIIDGSLDYDPTIRPVLDLTDVRAGMAQATSMFGISPRASLNYAPVKSDMASELASVLKLENRNRRLAAAGGGGTTYNITVNAPTGNARDIAREIERIIVRR